ncbi:MAG: single-stranded-DNA-specific exonuclease RecJ [Candidatus Paceibacterota bacterium]
MTKRWIYSALPDEVKNNQLTAYPEIVQRILLSRGIVKAEEAESFLNPDYDQLADPFLFKDMDKAVKRLTTAINHKEKVVIFGDYDADGVPASALLAEFFRLIGFDNFEVYIPHRHNEAYGLSLSAVERFGRQAVKLIVTVDCGITAIDEVRLANQLGIDVIITDHHLVPEVLPPAVAIIDPKQPDCRYPDKMLAGTGVAFRLAVALADRGHFSFKPGQEKWLLDLVAIATVSDMVPLLNENRILVYYGLKVLRQTRRPGLKKLLKLMRLKPEYLTEDDIGFMIGPRINSAGRMTHASEAYFLLTTTEEDLADRIAKRLEKRNQERKQSVESILAEAEAQLAEGESAGRARPTASAGQACPNSLPGRARPTVSSGQARPTVSSGQARPTRLSGRDLPAVVVCGGKHWPIGVLGLAAGRLTEKYQKSFFVWGHNGGGDLKGSCRSDGTVNVVDLMAVANSADQSTGGLFADFGGHKMAGGFSMSPEKLATLEESLNIAYETLDKSEAENEQLIDGELSLADINDNFYRELARLGPFGVGHPKPIFLFRGLCLEAVKRFGAGGRHLELVFKDGRRLVKGIAFFACQPEADAGLPQAHIFGEVDLAPGRVIDVLAQIEESFFGRWPVLRLRLVDLASSAPKN